MSVFVPSSFDPLSPSSLIEIDNTKKMIDGWGPTITQIERIFHVKVKISNFVSLAHYICLANRQ